MWGKGFYWLSIFCAAIGLALNIGPHPEIFFKPSIFLAGIASVCYVMSHIAGGVNRPEY